MGLKNDDIKDKIISEKEEDDNFQTDPLFKNYEKLSIRWKLINESLNRTAEYSIKSLDYTTQKFFKIYLEFASDARKVRDNFKIIDETVKKIHTQSMSDNECDKEDINISSKSEGEDWYSIPNVKKSKEIYTKQEDF